MRSNNPVLSRSESFTRGGYATFDDRRSGRTLEEMYAAPSATRVQTGRMTLDDVVVKTAVLFGILVSTAGISWYLNLGIGVGLAAALGAFVLAMVVSFKPAASPVLTMAYAALEGVFVGIVSHFYESRWDGVVPQAVLGTFAAFAAMLVVYRSGRLRATPKFTRMLMVAGLGYLLISLASMVAAFMGVGGGWGFRTGGLGLLLCVAGVAIASLFLILDFDFIEQGVRNGLPERMSWVAAFGLMVTLVWIYLELLRLIAILRGDD